MITICMEKWEIDALANHCKSSVRFAMNPQPTKEKDGMWHWKDCQWMDGGLDLLQSGIEDYVPFEKDGILMVKDTDFKLRISDVRMERLWEITDSSAQKEGCLERYPRKEYMKRWGISVCSPNRVMYPEFDGMSSEFGWNANPWVEVIEFDVINNPSAGCKYCAGKTQQSFQCNVEKYCGYGITKFVSVPAVRCPYCGRLLEKKVKEAEKATDIQISKEQMDKLIEEFLNIR